MAEQTIKCPNCGVSIPLTDVLTHDIKHQLKSEMEKQVREKEKQLAEKEQALLANQKNLDEQVNKKLEQGKVEMWKKAQEKAAEIKEVEFKNLQKDVEEKNQKLQKMQEQELELLKQKRNLEDKEKTMQLEMTRKLDEERRLIEEAAIKQAAEKHEIEFKDLQKSVEEKNRKLQEMQNQELELRKQKRELEEKEKTMQLELTRQMDEEREKILNSAKKEAAEETRMKVLEKDKQMDQMRKTIEDLKRKSEQGSMQIQGDVQENDLKETIQTAFPIDSIEDVPTGVRGADLIQTVNSNFGQKAGIILWESKNTKSWSKDWIKKLKDDQALVKADVCILISQALPEEIENFGFKDGIWICSYKFAIPLVSALRLNLSQIHQIKQSLVGKDQKMEFLYNYLSGSEFKNRIENIVSAFTSMKSDLETEKRSMQRIWNKREKEIERVIGNTSGMYGDLQGIIGASLPTIESLELPEGEISE